MYNNYYLFYHWCQVKSQVTDTIKAHKEIKISDYTSMRKFQQRFRLAKQTLPSRMYRLISINKLVMKINNNCWLGSTLVVGCTNQGIQKRRIFHWLIRYQYSRSTQDSSTYLDSRYLTEPNTEFFFFLHHHDIGSVLILNLLNTS